jgi:hypothetical protein
VIDHVTYVSDIVGAAVLDGYVPPATVCLQTRHRETLTRGNVLKAAGSGLARRCSTAAMQIENQREWGAAVISRRNKEPVRPLPLSRHQLLLGDPRWMRQIA